MVSLKHKFRSELPDSPNPSLIRPSNWNDEHDITVSTGRILGRVSPDDGVVEELTNEQVVAFVGLSEVATSGSYSDLTGKPTLGTAASHDAGDFVPSARTVNGKALANDVTLTADDVGDGTTNKAFTATEKSKLSGIAAGAEVNVNADWNSNSGDSQILNKPTLGSAASHAASDFATAAQGSKADTAAQLAELPWVIAAHNGVPGNGTDQTTALQAIIDGLPAEGGQILLTGDVRWTTLSAYQRRNIRFIGVGGYGAGASQQTTFRCTSGALGNGVSAFNLKQTMNVSFEQLVITNSNTAFTGTLLDYGDLTSGSALMTLRECILNVSSNVSGARGINLYGTTQGTFDRVKFTGARTLVQMQNASGVGWCNNHNFRSCSFNPTGSQWPVAGSGEGISFISCNVQASSGDGIGRFWSTDLTQQFRNVNVIGCTFYDVVTTGGVWCNFYTGKGLNFIGNMMGGAADITSGNNYGIQIGGGTDGVIGAPLGVTGGCVIGNEFRYMTAAISFGGTAGTYDNVRSMQIGANSCFGSLTPSGSTTLYSSGSSAENIVWLSSEQGSTLVNRALSALSGLTPAANKLPYFDGVGSAALADLTSFARTLLAASSAAGVTAVLGIREVLTANRSYYVRTDGSDSNNGLTNTSGGAFLTIQKAIDTACALDLSIYNVTINVADGTYAGAIALKPYLGFGPIAIVGNTASPGNCLLSGTGVRISAGATFVTYEMRGFETQTVTSGNSIALNGIGILKLNNWRFGACAGSHLRIDGGARLNGISGSFTISGSAAYFAIAGYSAAIDFNNATITLDASVTFTATAYAQYMAMVNFQQATFNLGAFSVTGQRYNASGNSLISSGGAGASFIPGSTAGATSSGGTYL